MTPKTERTKSLLSNALIELLKHRPFDMVTVADLTKTAGISRTAYYHHYKHKEEILIDALVLLLREKFENKLVNEAYIYGLEFIRDLIDFYDENGDLLLVISKWNLMEYISNSTKKTLNSILVKYLSEPCAIEHIDYYQYYMFSSMYNVLLSWVRKGKPESKEELYRICMLFYDMQNKYRTMAL